MAVIKETEKGKILMELLPLIQHKLMRLAGEAGEATVTVELRILMLLKERGTMTLSALGQALSVAKPNLVRPVRMLEEEGLVVRETDKLDHRVSRISVTDAGRRVLAAHQEKVSSSLAELTAPLPPSGREELYRAMKSLHSLLSSLE